MNRPFGAPNGATDKLSSDGPPTAPPVTWPALRRLYDAEVSLCRGLNGLSKIGVVRCVFWLASRLGDGVFWYVLMFVLPVAYGRAGLHTTMQMALTGVVGVLLYRWMKGRFVRERPHVSHESIHAAAKQLDQYSFPSGHTLHAVSFTLICLASFPELASLLVPFAILVGLSRPVLGLHYPTDVIAGAAIGWALASASASLREAAEPLLRLL
ncbi:MAG: phosphatase PAP2 family protein [Pseudomonadota bacterium]